MQKLKKEYNYKSRQVTVFLLLLVCIFAFGSCKSTTERRLPVTYETEIKQGERDGAHIDSLKVEILKKSSNGDYLLTYSIYGEITKEYWHSHMMLKKVRLIEEESNTSLYDRQITLTPVQNNFFGKAPMCPVPFFIKNEYLVKNNLENPIKRIKFVSGDKEYILELP